jgi:hypothetical protein
MALWTTPTPRTNTTSNPTRVEAFHMQMLFKTDRPPARPPSLKYTYKCTTGHSQNQLLSLQTDLKSLQARVGLNTPSTVTEASTSEANAAQFTSRLDKFENQPSPRTSRNGEMDAGNV